MEIIVGKTSGFCQGVEYTIKKAYEILNQTNKFNKQSEVKKKVYCLGEIVHNERVVSELASNGMIFVNKLSEIPDGNIVIIRAHGERKEIYDEISQRNLELVDLTCGKIRVIKNKILDNIDSYIVMIGKRKHPETLGTISFCKNGMIIEEESDLSELKSRVSQTNIKNIYILSQTTFNEELFLKLVNIIKETFDGYEIKVENTICKATHERQEETKEISKKCDIMIIIGGKNSSNTKELFNISNENCKNVFLIQGEDELDSILIDEKSLKDYLKKSNLARIGIMAGASTSREAVEEIIESLS